MTSYLDTSFLLKLYIDEADSPLAFKLLGRSGARPMISSLSEVEMSSSLHRLSASRRGFDETLLGPAYAMFRSDRSAETYDVVAIDDTVFELARLLGEAHGRTLQVRALDILHVAAAMRYGAAAFGTFDQRQAKLARVVGLRVLA